MSLPAPVILLPTNGANYATDVAVQTLSGTTSTDTQEIRVNGTTAGVTYTAGEQVWSWTGQLVSGSNLMTIVPYEKVTMLPGIAATITITLVQSDTFITVSPPTGVKLRQYQDKIEVVTSKNPEPQVMGYNFYVSTRSGGINDVYAPINTVLVTEYSFYEQKAKTLNRSVDTAGNIRVTTLTEEIDTIYYYSAFFDQDRFNALVAAGQIDPVTFTEDTKFFFVVSALIYDPSSGQVTESAYSAEMEGSVIVITTGIRDLPGRTQNDIILTFSDELLSSNQGVDTKPGTVVRDMMNPVSEEMARVYIIQDFLARSLSVSALLDFDDANGDGVSDPVSTSSRKQQLQLALNLQDPNEVQRIIDAQFDLLGSNVNVIREGAQPAVGTVTFYIVAPPVRDMYVYEGAVVSTMGDLDAGIASQNYRVTTSKVMEVASKDSFYNTATQRYELTADVEASTAGSAGNTDSYTIKTINSGVDSDFLVENGNPIAFGVDTETNHALGGRIQLAMFADTGTEGGYAKTTIAVPGVLNVRVEKAGDPLMIRDWDSLRKEHVGGKVDIYIQGKRTKQVSDQVAFAFGSIAAQGAQTGEIFQVISAVSFQFKSTNPRVSAHTPIFDVTRVHNATRGQDYDIAGYQIIGDGDTVDLNESLPINVAIGLASSDVVKVDYKYRGSDTFVMKNQPVLDVISVTGQISGELPSTSYELVKLEDFLENGGSTIAVDGVRILTAPSSTGIQTISNEPHIMILDKDESLLYLGADPESIVVKNQDSSVVYTENVDYRVTPGTDITATSIRMIESGSITDGEYVLVSYVAIENFLISYTTNALVEDVQTEIDSMKHACADVIVKQAVENAVDFSMTITPKTGVTNLSFLTSRIRTAVANFVSQQDVGTPLTQSEVVRIIQGIPDVSWIIIPFSRMVKADGSFITRDDLGKLQFQVFNSGVVNSYVTIAEVLTYKTVDQGGPSNMFRGVFEDGEALMLQSDPLDVSGGAGRAYIRGDGKIIVSTKDGQIPDNKSYSVAYYVYGETGSKDIDVASLEYLTVGTFTIVYNQPQAQSQIL